MIVNLKLYLACDFIFVDKCIVAAVYYTFQDIGLR